MEFLRWENMFLLFGAIILCISFFFKWLQIISKKHTIQISLNAWIIMLIGRILWSIYGFSLGTLGGIYILLVNGLISIMTIPIIYYILRNNETNGYYHKANFKRKLFFVRIILDVMITAAIIVMIVLWSIGIKLNQIASLSIGLLGGIFTAISLMPQTWKVIKIKNTVSTSLLLQITFIIGNSIIIAYLISMLSITNDVKSYIGSIIFGTISTLSMVPILIIKISNIKNINENIH